MPYYIGDNQGRIPFIRLCEDEYGDGWDWCKLEVATPFATREQAAEMMERLEMRWLLNRGIPWDTMELKIWEMNNDPT